MSALFCDRSSFHIYIIDKKTKKKKRKRTIITPISHIIRGVLFVFPHVLLVRGIMQIHKFQVEGKNVMFFSSVFDSHTKEEENRHLVVPQEEEQQQ